MSEETRTREVKPFGNGAHVTVPGEWLGEEVEITLQIPDTPDVFEGISEDSDVSVMLGGVGGEIHGVVESMRVYEYNKGKHVDYQVRCRLEDDEESYSELINRSQEVDFHEVSEFEIVVSRPTDEPWREDDMYVRFFHGEFCREFREKAPVEGLEFTVRREF